MNWGGDGEGGSGRGYGDACGDGGGNSSDKALLNYMSLLK